MADEQEVPEGWEWKPITVECDACGASNALHEQPPALLAAGVKWECVACGAANVLGGSPPAPGTADHVDECANCHATFDPNTVDKDADGSWTCSQCGVANRNVSVAEAASGSTRAAR